MTTRCVGDEPDATVRCKLRRDNGFGFVPMKKDYLLYAVAALIGVAIWVAIAAISGKREALGVIMFGVLSIPAILTARLGAFVATKRRASS